MESIPDFWTPPVDETVVHTPHTLMLAFNETAIATLTIAIPKFQRPHLIVDTLNSLLQQSGKTGISIVVIDNDPEASGHDALLATMPELRLLNFQYRRNDINVGVF
jgi:hypothetical protein